MESLISSAIPNFVNGVSQQPFTLRLNSQGSVQENGLSTVSQGLKKRPPTKHIKKIINTPLTNAFLHTINRDLSEQYVVIIRDGDLKVFNLAGVEQTVNFPEGKGYLASTNAAKDFSATTVADYTFIVNKTVKVQRNRLKTPKRPYEALVNIKGGQYGKTYKIFLNGTSVASYTTPDGGSPGHTANIDTTYIATQLATSYTNTILGKTLTGVTWASYQKQEYKQTNTTSSYWGGYNYGYSMVTTTYYTGATFTLPSGSTVDNTVIYVNKVPMKPTLVSGTTFSVAFKTTEVQPNLVAVNTDKTITLQRVGNVLHFHSQADFEIRSEDGFNGNSMFCIKEEVQYFNDLPTQSGIDGFVIKVKGDPSSNSKGYYAQWDESDGSTGVWKECVASEVPVGVYDDTMPWTLVRTSDGSFNFFSPTWKQRTVGDTTSAADPSFVGKPISDVFFYRNRLGFLCDESISMSEDGEPFNFYPKTVTTLLDDDRIDVTTAHTKVANLKHAIGFNRQLVIFSEQTQFLIDDTDTLTPKNISVKVTTEFPCNIKAKPVGIGKNIYFIADKDEFSQVREYFPDSNNFNYDSLDVTGHVPKYIPSGVYKLTGAPNEDTLIALTANERNALYVYRFFWSGAEKLQSAWSKFTFDSNTTILNADFLQSELLLVISRPDGVYLESMNFALGAIDGDEPYYVHMDRKVPLGTAALTYDSASGYTWVNTTTLDYVPQYGSYKAIVRSGIGFKSGTAVDVVWDGTHARMKGNWVGAQVTVGQVYTFKYTLSPITLRTQSAGGGQKSDTEGRLQIRKVALNYADTGFFDIKVTPEGRETVTYTFSGKKIGQDSGTIGTWNISTGRFQVPVITRNTTVDISIQNSSPLPCSFLSADWEGMYVKRSRAV
jgi:hypothetical protein